MVNCHQLYVNAVCQPFWFNDLHTKLVFSFPFSVTFLKFRLYLFLHFEICMAGDTSEFWICNLFPIIKDPIDTVIVNQIGEYRFLLKERYRSGIMLQNCPELKHSLKLKLATFRLFIIIIVPCI